MGEVLHEVILTVLVQYQKSILKDSNSDTVLLFLMPRTLQLISLIPQYRKIPVSPWDK